MADSGTVTLPTWPRDTFQDLMKWYFKSLQLEYAYETFLLRLEDSDTTIIDDEGNEETYMERITRMSADLFSEPGGGASGVADIETVKAVFGHTEADEGEDLNLGTNFVASRTDWRFFGLVTGYNLGNYYPMVLGSDGEPYAPAVNADFKQPVFSVGDLPWYKRWFDIGDDVDDYAAAIREKAEDAAVAKASTPLYLTTTKTKGWPEPFSSAKIGEAIPNSAMVSRIMSQQRFAEKVLFDRPSSQYAGRWGTDLSAQLVIDNFYKPGGSAHEVGQAGLMFGHLMDPFVITYLTVGTNGAPPEGTEGIRDALMTLREHISNVAKNTIKEHGGDPYTKYQAWYTPGHKLTIPEKQSIRVPLIPDTSLHNDPLAGGSLMGIMDSGDWVEPDWEARDLAEWTTIPGDSSPFGEGSSAFWGFNNTGDGSMPVGSKSIPEGIAIWPTLPLDNFVANYNRVNLKGEYDAANPADLPPWETDFPEGLSERREGTGLRRREQDWLATRARARYPDGGWSNAVGSRVADDQRAFGPPWRTTPEASLTPNRQKVLVSFQVMSRGMGPLESGDLRTAKAAPVDSRFQEVYDLGQVDVGKIWATQIAGSAAMKALKEEIKKFFTEGPWFTAAPALWNIAAPDALATNIEALLDFFGAGLTPEIEGTTVEDGPGTVTTATATQLPTERLKQLINFRNLKPLDFQCFLVENIGLLADVQDNNASYENLIQIQTMSERTGIDPGTLISVLKHGGKTDAVKALLNLSPAMYGALVPHIRIYRVDYSPTNPSKPIAQQEIPIPNFVDPTDITQLTGAGGGRYKGWGLQSFNWSLDGVQPETVDNNITATLQFYFQSVQDLFQGSLAAGQPTPNPLDLLISSRTLKTLTSTDEAADDTEEISLPPPDCKDMLKDNLHQAYEGANFRIKVVAGWAVPPPGTLKRIIPEKDKAEIDALRDALAATQTTLYLQQTRHNLDFKQDGSITLSINYQAALTGILTDQRTDILGPNDISVKPLLKEKEKVIKDAQADVESAREDVVAAREAHATHEGGGLEQPELRLKAKKKALQEALEVKQDIINMNRLQKYKRFLARLYGRDGDGTQTARAPKIYALEVDPKELFKVPIAQERDPKVRAKRALMRMSLSRETRGFRASALGEFSATGTAGANTDLLEEVQKKINEDLQLPKGEKKKKYADMAKNFKASWKSALGKEENIIIPYFYLGDLIDNILESNEDLRKDNGENKTYFFTGPMDVINPLLLYAAGNVEEILCSSTLNDASLLRQLRARKLMFKGKTYKRINIGSIPISLDLFNVWFKNNVIVKEKNSYYLQHFIKDLCAYLATDALNGECFGGRNNINNIRFDAAPISFHNKLESGAPRIHRGGVIKAATGTRSLGQAMGALDGNNDIPPDPKDVEALKKYDMSTGLVIYCTDALPSVRSGDYDKDLNNGIYHNYIGSSAGLVKNISFSRMDQEYLREAKIQKYGELGAAQLRELYSANMEMVGNALFRNGQYTYIWPTMIANDKLFARLLGIGGYFLVTGVSHTISPSGYNVSVQALQEGMRFDAEPQTVVAQGVADTPSLSDNPADVPPPRDEVILSADDFFAQQRQGEGGVEGEVLPDDILAADRGDESAADEGDVAP